MRNFKTYLYIGANILIIVLAFLIYKNAGQSLALLRQHAPHEEIIPHINYFFFLSVPALIVPFVVFLILLIVEFSKNISILKEQQSIQEVITDNKSTVEEENKKLLEEQKIEQRRRETEQISAKLKEGIREIEGQNIEEQEAIGTAILSLIAKHYNIVQGEIYLASPLKGENQVLKLLTTYAYYIPEGKITQFEIGEGLIGQVAQAKAPLNLDTIPEGFILIASGLGKATPSNLLILPLCTNDNQLVGVIELATFKPFDDFDVKLFNEAGMLLAKLFINETTKISE
ncbi:MAG: GAF domain-containing protein [Bacteroidales bacterium]|nr:GAF domain-containing protein [Bacteroidales bacterium]